jgi:hypothetical protein
VSTSAVGERERDRDDRVRASTFVGSGSTRRRLPFKTTEFLAYLATVAGVLIAAAVDETIDARLAWILVAAVGIGYMLSVGLRSREATTGKGPTRSDQSGPGWVRVEHPAARPLLSPLPCCC